MGVTEVTRQKLNSEGYRVSRDTLNQSEFATVRSDVVGDTETIVAAKDIEEDEAFRLGRGKDRGPEDTSGRLFVKLGDGAGNQPTDTATVGIVELTSQNNVERTIASVPYGEANDGLNNRSERVELPETGPILANPRRIGIQVQESNGNTFTVDLASSVIQIDAVRGER